MFWTCKSLNRLTMVESGNLPIKAPIFPYPFILRRDVIFARGTREVCQFIPLGLIA